MRKLLALTVLVLPACIDPPEELDLDSAEARLPAEGRLQILPDGRRAPVNEFAPEDEVEDEDERSEAPEPKRPRLAVVKPDEDEDDCYLDTLQVGLPAISDDGSAMVFVEYENTEAAEPWLIGSWLVTVDAQTTQELQRRPLTDAVWDGDALTDEAERKECRRHTRRLTRRVREVNTQLRSFRPLRKLDVMIVDPNRVEDEDPSEILPPRSLPADERPVQALYRSGWFSLRVPGIRVLSREAKLGWRELDPYGFCDTDPHLRSLWGDAQTGLGLVVLDHNSGGCLCYSDTQRVGITVPAAVFEETDRRPTAPYRERVEACYDDDC